MLNVNLNIIEPTLHDLAGHGYSYVSQVAKSAKEFGNKTHVWFDHRDPNLLRELNIFSHPWFYRKFRQLQKIILYYRLIKNKECIYVCTSELWDIKVLSLISRNIDTHSKIICHFHQFKKNRSKISSLKKIARNSPNIAIFTPTSRLSNIFKHTGFKSVKTIPCPSYPPKTTTYQPQKLEPYVIFAGAARDDKGFSKVVDTIKLANKSNSDIKFKIQASKPNSNRYDDKTKLAVDSLWSLPKNNRLQIISQTLTQQQYQDSFKNSIALLLYDQHSYCDKFSGVMLDAIYANCPVITTKDTWMGDITEKYDIGVTLKDHSPEKIISAIKVIKDNYQEYQNKALIAAELMKQEHDPINTVKSINELFPTTL